MRITNIRTQAILYKHSIWHQWRHFTVFSLGFIGFTLGLMGTPHGLYTERSDSSTCLLSEAHNVTQSPQLWKYYGSPLSDFYKHTRNKSGARTHSSFAPRISLRSFPERPRQNVHNSFQLFGFVCWTAFHLMYLLSVWQQSVFLEIENSLYLPYC